LCGVYIGRWRPQSRLEPHLRTRVAVKVLKKERKSLDGQADNFDIHHLLRMDFPYVNHFLGEFESSRQLDVGPNTPNTQYTIMVSSFCPGGDHWSSIWSPTCGSSICAIDLQFSPQHNRFCFYNPNESEEVVNHTMTNVVHVRGGLEVFSYVCVCQDVNNFEEGIICRVEKVDERYITLWSSNPPCALTARHVSGDGSESYPLTSKPDVTSFNVQFVPSRPFAKCFVLIAQIREQKITRVWKCLPRPNVSFIRAFSAQLLRALGYCHSRKLTAHNGEW
jgi:hypothetical protein